MKIKLFCHLLISIFIIGCSADDPLPAELLDVTCTNGKVEMYFSSSPQDIHVEYIEGAFSYSGDFGITGVKIPTKWEIKDKTVLTQCPTAVVPSYVYFISVTWLHSDTSFACPCKGNKK